MLPGIGLDHGAIVGDNLDLAVALPEREGVALGHRDMQPARVELEHGGIGNPGIGLEPRPRLAGVKEQQRRPPGDAGRCQNVLAAQPTLTSKGNRGDAEARQIGDGVAEVAEFRHDHRQMPAADGAIGGTRHDERQRRGDAGTTRQPPRLAGPTPAQGAHELDVADELQVQRNAHSGAHAPGLRRRAGRRARGGAIGHRFNEASSTIHRTSSSKVKPAWIASSGTSEVSVMPG